MEQELNMIINLTEQEKAVCKKFATDVVGTNVDKYRERNQCDVNKIINDIYVGKLGEFAVYNVLKHGGKTVDAPDVAIYGARKKSFSADLTDGRLKYHVKTMTASAAERYGLSWSFQIEDPLVKRPTDADVLVLCEEDNDTIDVKTFIKANRVCELYTKPKLAKLHYIKRVLMWEDIYNFIDKN
jgi:hypothetical protein